MYTSPVVYMYSTFHVLHCGHFSSPCCNIVLSYALMFVHGFSFEEVKICFLYTVSCGKLFCLRSIHWDLLVKVYY